MSAFSGPNFVCPEWRCPLNRGVPWIREVPINCAKLIVSYFDLLQTSCTQNLTINRVPTFWNIVRSKPIFCINLLNKFNRESSFCNIVHNKFHLVSTFCNNVRNKFHQVSSNYNFVRSRLYQLPPFCNILQSKFHSVSIFCSILRNQFFLHHFNNNNNNLIPILRAFHEMIKRALHDFYL